MFYIVREPLSLGGRMREPGDVLKGADADAVSADHELKVRCVAVADEPEPIAPNPLRVAPAPAGVVNGTETPPKP